MVIADCLYGIKRIPIAEGVVGVAKIGDLLLMEYIFRALAEISGIIGKPFRIIFPYAQGFDLKYPHLSPNDLFFPATVPNKARHLKSREEYERVVKAELEECARNYGVLTLPLDSETGLMNWCGANIGDDEGIIHLLSGQGAVNINLTIRMLNHFAESKESSIAAEGHEAGITPALYNRFYL